MSLRVLLFLVLFCASVFGCEPGSIVAMDAKGTALNCPGVIILGSSENASPDMGARIASAISAGYHEIVVAVSGFISSMLTVPASIHIRWSAGTFTTATSAVTTAVLKVTGDGVVLEGSDKSRSGIRLACDVGATVDGILIQGATADVYSGQIKNLGIGPVDGCGSAPGRYDLNIDGTTHNVTRMLFDNLELLRLGNSGVHTNGTFSTSTFSNSLVCNGMLLVDAGDTLRFRDNVFPNCSGGLTNVPALEASFVQGASSLIFEGNNCGMPGGCIKLGAWAFGAAIKNNEFEDTVGGAGTGGAMINIVGAFGKPATGTVIEGNKCQIVNTTTLNCLTVDYGTDTLIGSGNVFERGSAAVDIQVGAHAVGTYVGKNVWEGGKTLANILSDAGSGTINDSGITQ